MERVGLKGEVTDSKVPSTYKINYELDETPLISILIPNKDHIDDLKKCIDSILDYKMCIRDRTSRGLRQKVFSLAATSALHV